ncbi:DUF3592 domain-containing protein [Pollutimonas sp. H1-120]|uniref:hypothetical protein n=1 Tax=Pollutimonas sp. H1-120 TaxID=3148824 RepID=UPI003B51B7ED
MKTQLKEQLEIEKPESDIPSDWAVVLGAAAFSTLFGGSMMYALLEENSHPAWFWIMLAFSMLIFIILTVAFLPSRELKLAGRLSRSSQVSHTTGRVMKMRRRGTHESNTIRETKLGLELALNDLDGTDRRVSVNVLVEDVLMPHFATGRTVHVLYDPADPSRVAIDRRLTPVRVE